MKYGSVCSGIEAATMAWHPLGWEPAFFSEIEPFPSAVLAHHYPDVPNLGDMTKFLEWPDHAIDLLVGGTPCQSFSVAGLRQGLADPRGNLMLTYLAIARRYQPRWLVWENVPGVLSSNGGRDFAAFIRGLEECGYHAAWRVLDAQYVRVDGFPYAVPQRRRRVFVVGHLGDWRRSAAVLFEREGMRGDPAPSREPGKRAAGTLDGGAHPGGFNGQDAYNDKLIPSRAVAATLTRGAESSGKGGYAGRRQEDDDNLVAHTLKGEGFDASEDGTGRQNLIPITFDWQAGDGGLDDSFKGKSSSYIVDKPGRTRALVSNKTLAVAFAQNQREELRVMDVAGALAAEPGMKQQTFLATAWAVRRLTPTECERLQGFPDRFTAITHRKKPAADGPRYKALGNSMAVNVMRWIGRRIEMVEALTKDSAA